MPEKKISPKPTWFVYYLRCADNSLYAGVTTDLIRRLFEHNTCNKTGAKYTRARRPVKLVYAEAQENRQLACKREYQLKKFTKVEKENLVHSFTPNILTKVP
ncbi:MAG: putative endonuclease [Colwellia sp.]|jgi:putative endonuclease